MIERGNRQAVLDFAVTGQVRNNPFSDTRTSQPIQLKDARTQADFGFRQIAVERFPTTYSNLQFSVRISKTAKDGLNDLLVTIADISKTSPTLTVSQQALGVVSAAKAIADYLFNKQLLEQKLKSTLQFPSSGASLKAGTYAVLAGDNVDEYRPYLSTPAGGKGLEWTGAELKWSGKSIDQISYFVVRVSYEPQIFSDPMNALSFSKPWVSLYQLARQKARRPTTYDEATKVAPEIRSHLADAQTLLDSDLDLVQKERDLIHSTIYTDVSKAINDRLEQIYAMPDKSPDGGGGGGGVGPGGPHINLAPIP